MSNRKESHDGRPPLSPGYVEPGSSKSARIRIGRACDRCKVKKSKCDGNTPCSTCITSDSTCEYSARRRREARDWYWGMQDLIDEAMQRLYWACREGRGFPGVVPDESGGRVSTDAILRGLGLSPPPVDNVRPSGSRNDSVLDTQAQLLLPRSYHPPDVQPKASSLSRKLPTSTAATPMSTTSEDRLGYGESMSETGLRSTGNSVMDLDGEEDDAGEDMADGLPAGLADNLPDGLGEELHEGIDASLDDSMLQGGHVDYRMGGPMYMSDMGYDSGQMSMHTLEPYTIGSLNQQRLESVTQRLGMKEQEAWQGQQEDGPDGSLAWPGTMASIQRHGQSGRRRGGF